MQIVESLRLLNLSVIIETALKVVKVIFIAKANVFE